MPPTTYTFKDADVSIDNHVRFSAATLEVTVHGRLPKRVLDEMATLASLLRYECQQRWRECGGRDNNAPRFLFRHTEKLGRGGFRLILPHTCLALPEVTSDAITGYVRQARRDLGRALTEVGGTRTRRKPKTSVTARPGA